jgi:uncharacterized protein (TIRG00374 family)
MASKLWIVLRIGVGALIALTFAWLAFSGLDWGATWQNLSHLEPGLLLLALSLLAAGYLARIVRWWLILRTMAPELPLASIIGPFLAGMALNNVLPLRAGDVARAVGFRAQLQLYPSQVFGTLVVERLCDLLTLLVFFYIGLLVAGLTAVPEQFVTTMSWLVGLSLAMLVVVAVFGPAIEQVAMTWLRRLETADAEPSSPKGGRRLLGAVVKLMGAVSIIRSPQLALRLVLFSVLVWLCEGGMFAVVAAGLGIDVWAAPWFALTTGTLGTLVPGMPGHVGTFDYFAILGLLAFGVDQPSAAFFALTVHLLLWLPVTAAGLLSLAILKSRLLRLHEPLPVAVSND